MYYIQYYLVFSIYVDSIVQRLRMSGYGCVIGGLFVCCDGEFFGYIMYADDLVLVSCNNNNNNKNDDFYSAVTW